MKLERFIRELASAEPRDSNIDVLGAYCFLWCTFPVWLPIGWVIDRVHSFLDSLGARLR
jgi:hypothetical protein